MAGITVKPVPTGYNTWAEYYDVKKNEFDDFKKSLGGVAPSYRDPNRRKYDDLEWELRSIKYNVEDEKKVAKKRELEAQAAEAGMGPKEMKVVNTMNKYLATIEKFKTVAGPKAVKNNVISQDTLEGAVAFADKNVEIADACWQRCVNLNRFDWTFIRHTLVELSGKEKVSSYDEYIDIREFLPSGKASDLWSVTPDITNAVAGYCSSLSKRADAKEADDRISARSDAKVSKEKKYQEIRLKFYVAQEGGIPTLKKFLDDWKDDYFEYYTNEENKKKYETAFLKAKTAYETFKTENPRYWSFSVYSKDENERNLAYKYEELKDKHSGAYSEYYPFTKKPEEIKEDAKLIAEDMERKFITAVYTYSGDIESVSLHMGSGGNLNGIAIGKDGRKWKIETIYAGGYNIQKLHLRTLVHEIK